MARPCTDNMMQQVINFPATDHSFDSIYPDSVQLLARQHWTPLHVVRLATDFLTSGLHASRILDIGSGSGKFCLAGAHFAPQHNFYGVEQRGYILDEARRVQLHLGISNVNFIHANFTRIDLRDYDHFYFFNSFYENLSQQGRIDEDIEYSESLYDYYVQYLHNGLKRMPLGTKIATYHSLYREIPLNYDLVDSLESGNLNFWIKNRP
jgi:SAM-dependent methyltransferase